MYEYKTETFGCGFSTKSGFNSKLEDLLNEYAEEGWRLHTMQVAGASASICICVFEREAED